MAWDDRRTGVFECGSITISDKSVKKLACSRHNPVLAGSLCLFVDGLLSPFVLGVHPPDEPDRRPPWLRHRADSFPALT
jgi:hypothetical protein